MLPSRGSRARWKIVSPPPKPGASPRNSAGCERHLRLNKPEPRQRFFKRSCSQSPNKTNRLDQGPIEPRRRILLTAVRCAVRIGTFAVGSRRRMQAGLALRIAVARGEVADSEPADSIGLSRERSDVSLKREGVLASRSRAPVAAKDDNRRYSYGYKPRLSNHGLPDARYHLQDRGLLWSGPLQHSEG